MQETFFFQEVTAIFSSRYTYKKKINEFSSRKFSEQDFQVSGSRITLLSEQSGQWCTNKTTLFFLKVIKTLVFCAVFPPVFCKPSKTISLFSSGYLPLFCQLCRGFKSLRFEPVILNKVD